MIEQPLFQLSNAAVRILFVERKILVGIENYDIGEAQMSCFVSLDEFGEHRGERVARAQSQHTELALVFFDLNFGLYGICDMGCTLFQFRENICRNLLAASDFRPFYGCFRMVILFGNLVQYDFRT